MFPLFDAHNSIWWRSQPLWTYFIAQSTPSLNNSIVILEFSRSARSTTPAIQIVRTIPPTSPANRRPAESQGTHRLFSLADCRTGNRIRPLQIPDPFATLRNRRCPGSHRAPGKSLVPESPNEVQTNDNDNDANNANDANDANRRRVNRLNVGYPFCGAMRCFFIITILIGDYGSNLFPHYWCHSCRSASGGRVPEIPPR